MTTIDHDLQATEVVAPVPVRRRSPVALGRYSVVLIWAALMIFFALTAENFLSAGGIRFTLAGKSPVAFMTLALVLPLAAGVFDVSVGAMYGFAGMMLAQLEASDAIASNIVVNIVLVLVVCLAIGAANGFLVTVLKVNSFIATLGMSSVLVAATLQLSNNARVAGMFSERARAVVNDVWFLQQVKSFWYLLAIAGVLYWFLELTPKGRYLHATGGNMEATRLAGIRVGRYVAGSLVGSAGLAAVGGIFFVLQHNSASPDSGIPLLFGAFAAVFLGATQFSQRPNVLGTLVSVFMLAFLTRGLQIKFPGNTAVDPFANGLVLLLAVGVVAINFQPLKRWLRRDRRTTGREGGPAARGT